MYSLVLHKSLSPQRWSQFPVEQQLLMVGNELQRLKFGLESDLDESTLKEGIERSLELLDLTIECQSGNLRKELLRFRSLIALLYLKTREELQNKLAYVSDLIKVFLSLNRETAKLL